MLLSCSASSSLMHVIHVFGCRPQLFLPCVWQCNAVSGNCSPSILVTCPNHASHRFLIFWTSDSFCYSILHAVSFLILSPLVTHNNLLNQAISSSFFKHQHSDPYTSIDTKKISYNLSLTLFEMLYDFHILLNLFRITDAKLILLFMSFVHFPACVMTLPRYTNLSTCSSSSISNVVVI